MEVDITNPLARIMVRDDESLPDRLRMQKKHLEEMTCSDDQIGSLLEIYELPVLIEILQSDRYFDKHFPQLKTLDHSKRRAFAEKVREHAQSCLRCQLKVSFDLEWEAAVETSILTHRKSLRETAEAEQGSSETDHQKNMAFN